MKILVYGTLRKGQYNYDRVRQIFGKDSFVKIDTRKVDGFNMYNLGPYPCITKGKGTITCELMEAKTEAANFIKRMELGAGYEEVQIDDAVIYTMTEDLPEDMIIPSGDWVNRNIPEKQD